MVVSWNGDGCFLMNGQELATAVQYGLAVIFVVVDNGMYGTIRMHQERNYPARVSGTDLVNPGLRRARPRLWRAWRDRRRTDEFAPAFERALASGKPALLHLKLDPQALTLNASLDALRAQGIGSARASGVEAGRTPRRRAPRTYRSPPNLPPLPHPLPSDRPRAHRGRLFRKYLLLILTLVSGALLASGGISVYFSYQENKSALASLQHEKAIAAASRIEQYIRQIEQQLAYAALPQLDAERRRVAPHRVPEAAAPGAGGHRHRAARRRRPRADRRVAPGHGRHRARARTARRSRRSATPSAASPGSARCTSARRPSRT